MALLDSPAQRVKLVTAVETYGGVQAAAQHMGISRQSIGAYLRTHPDLKLEVDAARRRYETIAHHAPRVLPGTPARVAGTPARVDVVQGSPEQGLAFVRQVDRERLLDTLEMHANDPESRGCAKALHILAELAFAQELIQIRAEAKRLERESVAGDARPIVVRVPMAAGPDGAIDAEVMS